MDADHTVEFTEYQLPLGRLQLPAEGAVDLWWINLDSVGGSIMSGGTVPVKISERVSARRFTSRFLTRMLLGAYLDIPGKDVILVRNRYGKPDLDPAYHEEPLYFNISHSHQWMLFAVNVTSLLGVDIENSDRHTDPLRLANRYFSQSELAALEQLDKDQQKFAFLHAWTHKEAVLKARGMGLAGNMDQVIVDIWPAATAKVLDDGAGGSSWHLQDLPLEDGMIGALAFAGNLKVINARRLLAPKAD